MYPAHHNGNRRRRRRLEPPLGPNVLAERNKEMRTRLSASSLVLGDAGPETRDWSLSSTQQKPPAEGALDPAQRAINNAMKKGVHIQNRRAYAGTTFVSSPFCAYEYSYKCKQRVLLTSARTKRSAERVSTFSLKASHLLLVLHSITNGPDRAWGGSCRVGVVERNAGADGRHVSLQRAPRHRDREFHQDFEVRSLCNGKRNQSAAVHFYVS